MTTVDTFAGNNNSFHTSWQDNILLKSVFESRPGENIDPIFNQRFLDGSCFLPNSGGQGSSSISVSEEQHKLIGTAHSNYYSFTLSPNSECSVTATMSGPGVSESGGDTSCNSYARLESTTYQPNNQYCILATHTFPNGPCNTQACIVTPNAKVTSVVFEQIATDDLPIDTNPKEGYGYRIYPDDKIPDDTVDRRKVRSLSRSYARCA